MQLLYCQSIEINLEREEEAQLVHNGPADPCAPKVSKDPKLLHQLPRPPLKLQNSPNTYLQNMCSRRPEFFKIQSKDWDGNHLVEKSLRKFSSGGTLASLNGEAHSNSFAKKKCKKCSKCQRRRRQRAEHIPTATSAVLPVTTLNHIANHPASAQQQGSFVANSSIQLISSYQDSTCHTKQEADIFQASRRADPSSPRGRSILIEPNRRITVNQIDSKTALPANQSDTSILPKRPPKKVSFAEEISRDSLKE
jgi:hypothetical protein